MTTTAEHYQLLFAPVEAEVGPLGEDTFIGIVGFGGGGPVSVCQARHTSVVVTCELSLYPEQIVSADGLKYELLTRLPVSVAEAQTLLTALGNLSMKATLGDGHTIDVSGVLDNGLHTVRLRHYSSTAVGKTQCGIYEVIRDDA